MTLRRPSTPPAGSSRPGFVDIHTHYDGQVSWDETLEPSSMHGVTTVVSGNCGVGFAPVRPGREQWLIELMEGVEDIPGTALTEGITWQWESFPEYLDAIEKRSLAVDYGTQIAHGAVRGYAMGERGARNEEATEDDIAAMARIVQEAIEAGRWVSRPRAPRATVPSTASRCPAPTPPRQNCSAWAGRWPRAAGPSSRWPRRARRRESRRWRACANSTGWPGWRPRSTGRCRSRMIQSSGLPDLWRDSWTGPVRPSRTASEMYAQIAARPFGMLFGFPGHHAFTHRPDVPQAEG